MPDPTIPVTPNPGTVTPAAPASGSTAVTPVPAPAAQPSPEVKPGVTPAGDAKPDTQNVPIGALLEERSKRQALESEMAVLRQAQVHQQPMQAPMQQQQQSQAYQEVEKLWESDPRKAVDATIAMALDWYDRSNTDLEQQADALGSKYHDFNQYRSSAMRYVRSLPIQQRGQQGILDSAYWYVRGQSVDDIIKARETELMRKFQSGELAGQFNTPAGTMPASTPSQGVALSQDQLNVAAAMGMSAEDYAKNIKPGGTQ